MMTRFYPCCGSGSISSQDSDPHGWQWIQILESGSCKFQLWKNQNYYNKLIKVIVGVSEPYTLIRFLGIRIQIFCTIPYVTDPDQGIKIFFIKGL